MDIKGVGDLTAGKINATTYYDGPYILKTSYTDASTYNVTSTDIFIAAEATLNQVTVNLPLASTAGRVLTIKNITSEGENTVVVSASGEDAIDGAESQILTNLSSITVLSDEESDWYIIQRYTPS